MVLAACSIAWGFFMMPVNPDANTPILGVSHWDPSLHNFSMLAHTCASLPDLYLQLS